MLVNLNVAAHDGSCEGPDLGRLDLLTGEHSGRKKENLGDEVRARAFPSPASITPKIPVRPIAVTSACFVIVPLMIAMLKAG